MKKPLPLFNADAPIACTIDEADKPGRARLLEEMRERVTSHHRMEQGIVLHFPEDARPLFAEFAKAERTCCAFFGFAVEPASMRWEAPPSAIALIDQIHRFFDDSTTSAEDLRSAL